MTAPQISTALDTDSGEYVLYATTRFGLDVAGPRLFRAGPWPDITWRSPTEDEATRQAATLQRYLDSVYSQRGPSRAKVKHAGE